VLSIPGINDGAFRTTPGNRLDTNVILIAPDDPGRLSQAVQTAVLVQPNYLSVVSYWEVMLKSIKGHLIERDPQTWWQDALKELAAVPLLLHPQQIGGLSTLPPIHKDPFDRILIAQATVEGLTLVTTNSEIPRCVAPGFR
jgi:PIN domain nuclease of toxin-antitoxin system